MNKTELEYMISLADEKYIDEIFTDRIHSKRKNIFAGIGAAAAVLALICGIGFAVSRTDTNDDIVAGTTPDSTLIDIIDEQVDYSLYFRNTLDDLEPSDFTIEGDGGVYCRFDFDDEYMKNILPIDTSDFNGGSSQLYFDYSDKVKYIAMRFSKREDKTLALLKSCEIYVGREGSLLSNFKLDTAISQVRFDTEIYGVEYDDNVLGLLFTTGGRDYMIEAKNMSYDDVGAVMDAVLINGISEENFDLSKASELEYYDISAYLSLAEANLIAPFAGCVPQLDSIGDMYFANHVVYSATRDVAHTLIDPNITYNYYDGGERDMSIMFYTKGSGIEPYENIVHINNVTPGLFSSFEREDGIFCTIECDGFNVNIFGYNCTGDDVLAFWNALIDEIYDPDPDTDYTEETRQVTLEYANEATAFSGFVPQMESIGVMDVRYVTYSQFFVGNVPADSTLHIEYLPGTPYNYQFIIAEYQENFDRSYPDIIKIEGLTENMAKVTAGFPTDPEDNFYRFAIQCGEFYIYITAECPEETMREYLRELKNTCPEYITMTLEEAAASEYTDGYVPMTEKIGSMTLDEGYCRILECNDGEELLFIKYKDPYFKYMNDRYDHYGKYISTLYYKPVDYEPVGAVKLEELRSAPSDAIDLEDSGVRKFRFTIDCGSVRIRVEALCDDAEMCEYINALKAAAANMAR